MMYKPRTRKGSVCKNTVKRLIKKTGEVRVYEYWETWITDADGVQVRVYHGKGRERAYLVRAEMCGSCVTIVKEEVGGVIVRGVR